MALSFSILKNQNAARLFYGQLISQVCDKMMSLGLVWIISNLGSLREIPWFLAAGALPHLLFAHWSGGVVQRFGSLKTVILTDAVRGFIFLAAAILWWRSPLPTTTTIPLFFILTFIANSASAFFNPAILSLPMQLPQAKDRLVGQLTAMIDSCFSMGNILGPLAAALIYPWTGLAGLFLINALSYFLAAILEAGIRLELDASVNSNQAPSEKIPLTSRKDSLIRFMLSLFFCMNLVLTPMFTFLPLFAKVLFQGSLNVLAALELALGLGTVLGGLALTVFKSEMKIGRRTLLGSFIVSLAYLLFSFNHNSLLACVALFILGLSLSVVNISLLTFFQVRPAPEQVPRVMSLVNLISVGALPFSMILVGGILEKLNLQALAIICATAFLGLTIVASFHRELREA